MSNMGLNDSQKNMLQEFLKQMKQDDSVLRARMNDERIMLLAEYDATKGLIDVTVPVDTFREKFKEFKQLIKRGSFTLKSLEDSNRIIIRYVGENPNGSRNLIAGITNKRGNVVGLMPHPEHAVDSLTGPSTNGLPFFTSVLTALVGK